MWTSDVKGHIMPTVQKGTTDKDLMFYDGWSGREEGGYVW